MKVYRFLKNNTAYALVCMVLFTLIFTFAYGIYDTDIYYMLYEGKKIVSNGISFHNDLFVVPGCRVVIQQWLWDLVLYWINNCFGFIGIYVFTAILIAFLLYLIVRLGKVKNTDVKTYFFGSLIALALARTVLLYKASIVTLILLVIQIIITEKYKKTGNFKSLIWIPIFVIIEANVHASMWIFHLVFMLPYVFPAIKNIAIKFEKRTYKTLPLILTMVVSIPCSLINPYGADGALYLFLSYNKDLNSIGIGELLMPYVISRNGILILTAFTWLLVLVLKKVQVECEYVYLVLGTAILAVMHYRNVWFLALAIIITLADVLKDRDNEKFYAFVRKQPKSVYLLLFFGIICGIVINFKEASSSHDDSLEAIVNEIDNDSSGKEAKVFSPFNVGSYVRYRGYICYMDSRPELYMKTINKKEDFLKEYIKIVTTSDKETMDSFDEKYRWDYYITEEDTFLDLYMQENKKLVMKQGEYNLYK